MFNLDKTRQIATKNAILSRQAKRRLYYFLTLLGLKSTHPISGGHGRVREPPLPTLARGRGIYSATVRDLKVLTSFTGDAYPVVRRSKFTKLIGNEEKIFNFMVVEDRVKTILGTPGLRPFGMSKDYQTDAFG